MAKEAARAGVHGGDQHKAGGEGQRAGGARNGDKAVFKRLAQDFQRAPRKLREFIQKQNAVVA